MKIGIFQQYDGFAIEVDGERWTINQEDTVEALVEVFETVAGTAEVTFEEEC